MDNILSQPIDVLEFTIRTTNVLKSENIMCVGDLVQRSEIELQRTPNLGKKALTEINETFEALNLSFGMTLPPVTKHTINRRRTMIATHLKLLGLQMTDRVTGFEGMVDSISFDVYGCIQACVRPKQAKDGTLPDGHWFDVKRMRATGKRLMETPLHAFATTPVGQEPGPADKPAFDSLPARN